jgi:PAT family beta-lactamase induction signal transducer AmpG
VLAETIGWPVFFIASTVAAVPALVMLWWMRATVQALDVPAGPATLQD